jgi:hypothetical protein
VVLGVSGFMVFIEFFADKIPGLDSLWDVVHGVIRIPAGAALAAAVFGADNGLGALVAACWAARWPPPALPPRPPAARPSTPRPSPSATSSPRCSKTAWCRWACGWRLRTAGVCRAAGRRAGAQRLADQVLLALPALSAVLVRVARIFSGRPDPGTAAAFTLKSPGDSKNDHV